MLKSCPEQQFASFGKEVILQKTHPQQKKICKRKLKIWNDHLQNFAKKMAGKDKMQNQSDHDHKIILWLP